MQCGQIDSYLLLKFILTTLDKDHEFDCVPLNAKMRQCQLRVGFVMKSEWSAVLPQ